MSCLRPGAGCHAYIQFPNGTGHLAIHSSLPGAQGQIIEEQALT